MTTALELFNNVMNFEPAERTLNWELGYWGETINEWYRQGLPEIKGVPRKIAGAETIGGPGLHWPLHSVDMGLVKDHDVSTYFQMDEGLQLVPYNYWLYPFYEEKIIEDTDEYTEMYDRHGRRVKMVKDNYCVPMYLEHPLKTRDDWEQIKYERFSLDSIQDRYTEDKQIFLEKSKNKTYPLGIYCHPVGFYGSMRFLIGEPEILYLYYDDPDLVKDIADHLCELWLAIAEEMTSEIDFDFACFWEDMSGKQGAIISPDMFRQFMTPYYRRIIDLLSSKGIRNYVVDTDGCVDGLIPLFMEAGVNAMYPFERQAGNDLLKIRKKYPDLRMLGGFDKNTLTQGKDSIDREIAIVMELAKTGGYIPFCDHLVPPIVNWNDYTYFRNTLKDSIMSTKIL